MCYVLSLGLGVVFPPPVFPSRLLAPAPAGAGPMNTQVTLMWPSLAKHVCRPRYRMSRPSIPSRPGSPTNGGASRHTTTGRQCPTIPVLPSHWRPRPLRCSVGADPPTIDFHPLAFLLFFLIPFSWMRWQLPWDLSFIGSLTPPCNHLFRSSQMYLVAWHRVMPSPTPGRCVS